MSYDHTSTTPTSSPSQSPSASPSPSPSPSRDELQAEILEQEPGDGELFKKERNQEKIASKKLYEKLITARTWDTWIQIGLRVVTALFFYTLLGVQNYWLFQMVSNVLAQKGMNAVYLEPVLAIIIPSTLAETYYIAVKIVEWVLKPINYNVSRKET